MLHVLMIYVSNIVTWSNMLWECDSRAPKIIQHLSISSNPRDLYTDSIPFIYICISYMMMPHVPIYCLTSEIHVFLQWQGNLRRETISRWNHCRFHHAESLFLLGR